MYTLAFDTTAARCSIALFSDEHCVDTFVKEMEFGQAETLIPEIQNILQKHNLNFSNLDLIVVCVGPGSFTGVRSSIASARSFGLACPHLEVLGVNAFDTYAHSLQWHPDEIGDLNAVIIETKRNDFYYQIFDNNLQAITEASAANREDIINLLRNKKVTFVGDGVERFLNSPTGLSLHAIINSQGIDIKDLATCGISRYRRKQHNYPKPLYLRAPDVCVKS